MGTYSSEFHRRTPDIIVYLYVLKEAKGNRIVLSLSIELRLLVDVLLAAVNKELETRRNMFVRTRSQSPLGDLYFLMKLKLTDRTPLDG